MTTLAVLLLVVGVPAAVYLVLGAGVYRRFHGTRLVTCPETGESAAVDVDAVHLALSLTAGNADLRLATCSRWRERADCGQECLRQIERAPDGCLVRTMLARWYEGKSCAYCGKRFGTIESWGQRAAFLTPGGDTTEWAEVRAETLPALLATHQPVCWGCHVTDTFRRRHPELVTDRPAHHGSR